VSAADIYIQVGLNLSATNGSTVFTPQEVHAIIGDTIFFNITAGNHSVIESTFAQPCIPSGEASPPINGFISPPENAINGTNVTYSVAVVNNNSMWYYDPGTCGIGGVGVINANDSSNQTLAGFQRNAIRLNGTGATTSSSASHSPTSSPSNSPSGSASGGSTSSAERNVLLGGLVALPLAIAALVL